MKADLDLVKVTMQRHTVETPKVSAILRDIQAQLAAQKEAKEPQEKKQYVVLKSKGTDLAWVVQITEDNNPAEAIVGIGLSAHAFNQSKKGRRLPVKTLGEALEFIKPSEFKQNGVWVKTREPVAVVEVENKLS